MKQEFSTRSILDLTISDSEDSDKVSAEKKIAGGKAKKRVRRRVPAKTTPTWHDKIDHQSAISITRK